LVDNSSSVTAATNYSAHVDMSTPLSAAGEAMWQRRMREVQGGLLVAALAQMLIGATGLASVLLRYIGPLTVAPVITLVAVPLFDVAAGFCDKNWWITFL